MITGLKFYIIPPLHVRVKSTVRIYQICDTTSASEHSAIHPYNFMVIYMIHPRISLRSLNRLHLQVTGAFPSVALCHPDSAVLLQLLERELKDSSGNSPSTSCLHSLVHVEQVKVSLKLRGYQRHYVC